MSKRVISKRFIDSFRPGDDLTGQYDDDTLADFVRRGIARVEGQALDDLSLEELRETAKERGVEYYWQKGRETLLEELEED